MEHAINETKMYMFEQDRLIYQTDNLEVVRKVYNDMNDLKLQDYFNEDIWKVIGKKMIKTPVDEEFMEGFNSIDPIWFVSYI